TEVPADWIVLAMVVIATKTVWGVVMAIWRVKDRAVVFGVFQNAQSGVIVAGTLTLVVALERGWEGRIEAELIAWAISGVLAFLALRRIGLLRWVFVRDHARNLLRFGVPLIPHALGAVLIVQTDRTFITNFVSVEETGIFTVGYQLALIIELVAMSFNSAYSPWLYRKLKDADHAMKAKLVRYTYMHFVGIAVFALVVALIMPPLAGWLLDPSYERAGVYVHWFAVAFAFSGMYYMVSNYVLYAEKNAWLATATLTTAVINIPLNYVLIELNGAIGAAQATAIAMALSFVLTWYAAARVFPMPWSRSRVG
ncbi:MAG: polysaccharide biosynthesis C-terminal domain-containing protein, partial [Deltaproteobacteria bacterium]|nr:polysaccharide biosynthesis C-terminal domain-containing protein [Deltaproteobacteria bacterium]